jgi:hypothetical protein
MYGSLCGAPDMICYGYDYRCVDFQTDTADRWIAKGEGCYNIQMILVAPYAVDELLISRKGKDRPA